MKKILSIMLLLSLAQAVDAQNRTTAIEGNWTTTDSADGKLFLYFTEPGTGHLTRSKDQRGNTASFRYELLDSAKRIFQVTGNEVNGKEKMTLQLKGRDTLLLYFGIWPAPADTPRRTIKWGWSQPVSVVFTRITREFPFEGSIDSLVNEIEDGITARRFLELTVTTKGSNDSIVSNRRYYVDTSSGWVVKAILDSTFEDEHSRLYTRITLYFWYDQIAKHLLWEYGKKDGDHWGIQIGPGFASAKQGPYRGRLGHDWQAADLDMDIRGHFSWRIHQLKRIQRRYGNE